MTGGVINLNTVSWRLCHLHTTEIWIPQAPYLILDAITLVNNIITHAVVTLLKLHNCRNEDILDGIVNVYLQV